MNVITPPVILQFYIAQLVCFSICILSLRTSRRSVLVWLSSNVIGGIGFLLTYLEFNFAMMFAGGPILSAFAGALKASVLMDGSARLQRNRLGALLILLSLFWSAVIVLYGHGIFKVALYCLSGMCSTGGMLIIVLRSRKLAGMTSQRILVALLSVCTTAFLIRFIAAPPIGNHLPIFGPHSKDTVGLVILAVSTFFLQMAFFIHLAEYNTRQGVLHERLQVRARERAYALQLRQAETVRIAEERLQLISLLTHEVRQPLNNAQAVIQHLLAQLSTVPLNKSALETAILRAQKILDGIISSLSNAIAGSHLINRSTPPQVARLDLVELTELVLLEFQPEDRGRLSFHPEEPRMFVSVNPILMRISLRNLIENALRYSPKESPIVLTLCYNDERCGVTLRLVNEMAHPGLMEGDILQRGQRGKEEMGVGSGLGLFIASETARLHNGELRAAVTQGHQAEFELFIPS